MILQSLVNYYEILANDDNSNIPRLGYSKANVSYAANISPEGELLNIIPLKISVPRGKKTVEVPQAMDVPEQINKASSIKSNFLCENATYFFGFGKVKPERAKQCFEA
ncbi:MAG: type I-C CRISPR-associated protein Cas8c/Csd1, partial [Clostridiales bacterium]|nr:type I-C CRISPR-associated protein Cas8c/Csd1 [Clostridiales bacterium]